MASEAEITIKYEGYIQRQLRQVEEVKRLEARPLPADLDYQSIQGLRLEARQKLNDIRPQNLGQASPGVRGIPGGRGGADGIFEAK